MLNFTEKGYSLSPSNHSGTKYRLLVYLALFFFSLLKENVLLVFRCFTLAGINTMAFSSIRVTLVETMVDGKPHALEIIAL